MILDEKEIRKKLNQVIEKENLFKKQERKGLRNDWYTAFELYGQRIALEYVLNDNN